MSVHINASMVKIRHLVHNDSYCAHKHLLAQIWQLKSRTDFDKKVKITKSNQVFIMSQYYM